MHCNHNACMTSQHANPALADTSLLAWDYNQLSCQFYMFSAHIQTLPSKVYLFISVVCFDRGNDLSFRIQFLTTTLFFFHFFGYLVLVLPALSQYGLVSEVLLCLTLGRTLWLRYICHKACICTQHKDNIV